MEQHLESIRPMDPRCHRIGVQVVTFVGTFLVIFGGVLGYALNRTPVYRATAVLQVVRGDKIKPDIPNGDYANGDYVESVTDFNTRVRLVESPDIAKAVADSLKPDERKRFMAPFEAGIHFGAAPTLEERLMDGRAVQGDGKSLMINVSFEHPDPEVAAQIANDFAEEFIAREARITADNVKMLTEDLQGRAAEQKKKAENIQGEMNDMIAKYGRAIFDPANNTESEKNVLDLAKIQAEYKTLEGNLKDAQTMSNDFTTSAATEQTEFNLYAPPYRMADMAVPTADPVGLTMAELVWMGLGVGLAGGGLVTALVARVMAYRRLRRGLPPAQGRWA
jgi:uncharacterized protein involved in exopolysaccharide biosynthesis